MQGDSRLPQLQSRPGRAPQCLLIQPAEQTTIPLRPVLVQVLHERITGPQRQRRPVRPQSSRRVPGGKRHPAPLSGGGKRLRIHPAPVIISENITALTGQDQAALTQSTPRTARQHRQVRLRISRHPLRPQRLHQHIPGNHPPPLPEQDLHQLPHPPPPKRAAGDLPPSPPHPETAQQPELHPGVHPNRRTRNRQAAIRPAAAQRARRTPRQHRPRTPQILRRQIQPIHSTPDFAHATHRSPISSRPEHPPATPHPSHSPPDANPAAASPQTVPQQTHPALRRDSLAAPLTPAASAMTFVLFL